MQLAWATWRIQANPKVLDIIIFAKFLLPCKVTSSFIGFRDQDRDILGGECIILPTVLNCFFFFFFVFLGLHSRHIEFPRLGVKLEP